MPTLLSHRTPLNAVASALPVVDSPVRLGLDPVRAGRGSLDGAWWPYSQDAAAELPGLIAAVDQRLGRTTLRICLHTDAWEHVPGCIPARGRQIEVGRLYGTDPRLVTLMFAGTDAVNLVTMPSDRTGGPVAAGFGTAFGGTFDLRPLDLSHHRPPSASSGLGTPDRHGSAGDENDTADRDDDHRAHHVLARASPAVTRTVPETAGGRLAGTRHPSSRGAPRVTIVDTAPFGRADPSAPTTIQLSGEIDRFTGPALARGFAERPVA
ncbi:DUF5994 family protein [Actinoallomurus spadix]|uniref:Uncharacterized protein n=2 Tax=Actinoallomurus spadix TaxID=79912 RepID=A0ABP3GQJ9_9ACTN|nr:DUF5994 family protein [Actinoallomurus spadix]